MTLKAGSRLSAYTLTRDFTTAGAGNCRWTFAERDGREFFVKEFLKPKRPRAGLPPEIAEQKLVRCRRFEERYKRLVEKVGPVVASGGNIVMPVNFFHVDNVYYLIALRIETTSLTPAEVARLPAADRLRLMRLLARALRTIHDQALVHGDLKPTNILIQKTERGFYAPKLIDFDGSFFVGDRPEQEDMANDQSYMAPEVMAYNRRDGDTPAAAARLGTAADVFSLGILMHEYWTGRRPAPEGGGYPAEAAAAGRAIRLDAPGLPAGLSTLLQRMLSGEPASRPNIRDVEDAIAEAQKALTAAVPAKAPAAPAKPAAPAPAPSASSWSKFKGGLAKNLAAGPTPRPGFAEPPPSPIEPPADPRPEGAASRLVIGKRPKPRA